MSGTTTTNTPFEPTGAVAVVTGGAGGIGRALGRALHAAGAAAVVLADLDAERVRDVAEHVARGSDGPGVIEGVVLDVTDREATAALVEEIAGRHGPVDLWCANAGVGTAMGLECPPERWQQVWEVNTMGVVHAAAVLLPGWLVRGRGHLLVTASAAGLLTNLGDVVYSSTKHAAVGLAEWLAITHGDAGLSVSCLCPQGVRTPMLFGAAADELADVTPVTSEGLSGDELAARSVTAQRVLEPDDVAAAALDALVAGRFLVLPHEEVAGYEQARAADHDRWIRGMRRLQADLGP